ncbi:MAG: hypothetical protein H6732_10820 [Alphaproteobacteria bacterium]|nr:hypothetical protein [Alphaproteobacteria bacterium]
MPTRALPLMLSLLALAPAARAEDEPLVTFEGGTVIRSADVNHNFQELEARIGQIGGAPTTWTETVDLKAADTATCARWSFLCSEATGPFALHVLDHPSLNGKPDANALVRLVLHLSTDLLGIIGVTSQTPAEVADYYLHDQVPSRFGTVHLAYLEDQARWALLLNHGYQASVAAASSANAAYRITVFP